jgi:hypothetical protein
MKKVITVLIVFVVIFAGFSFTGEKAKDGRFIAYDDGTVLDTKTNLMWADKDNGIPIVWKEAKSYCNNYRAGGYKNWRMPTRAELADLYDETKSYDPKCPWNEPIGNDSFKGSIHITKLIHLTCGFVWASDTIGASVTCFCFISGKGYWIHGNPHYALPVRSAK